MKNFKTLLLLAVFAIVGLSSCEQNDDLVFTAAPQGGFELTNTILPEYVLPASTDADDNIGVVFTWNPANFNVQTNISYEVQYSLLGDFSDAATLDNLGATSENQITINIGQLKSIATLSGLDNDPDTTEPDTGDLMFRLRAYPGDTGSTTEQFSSNQPLTVRLLEAASSGGSSGIEPVSWGIVGSGYNNWGAYEDQTFYSTSEANIFVTYATLVDGEIKFRENDMWDNDFGDTGADGTLDAGGDNIVVTAGTYKITMNLNDNTYSIEPFSWGVVGSGYNDWGATPDGKFYYDYVTDTFKVGIRLVDGEIKFRQNNEWNIDFGDTGADGTLEAGGDNIAVTAGHYTITLDFNANTYTIETSDLYGIVGSGYNDWGATQDFTLTPLSNDIWVGDIVTLIDGEIKFRVNDDWASDFGDTGADGTLDAGGDNIAVTAGDYRIKLDITNSTYSIN
ncbi:SusE domain-containing protein [uncultured Lacinutrix sp.]|uniref:SusE domain-containing protein n=1 Tax=uncultured Lacinutrix sp. TaxID=574032 RepID=UPI00261533F6|nr:SusE domain-containing protein [uncultured Lacinutrix sp.]